MGREHGASCADWSRVSTASAIRSRLPNVEDVLARR